MFIFSRIRKDKNPKSFMVHTIKEDKQSKPFVFPRIKTDGKSSSPLLGQERGPVSNCLGETNEFPSPISSYIKCIFTLDVKIDGTLKVKRYNLVIIISHEASPNSKERAQEKEQVSFNHVTINDLDDDMELVEAPNTLEKEYIKLLFE